VVMGKWKPQDRSEEELAAYRRALGCIFSGKRAVPVTPNAVTKLHTRPSRRRRRRRKEEGG
jgi:hypothetical protein